MKTESFRGRDFITDLEFTKEELETILEVAWDLKKKRAIGEPHELLKGKTLFMIFYNQSLRTRNSFEAGMHQLGGHAHDLNPKQIYTPALPGREIAYSTERVSDVARVLSRMGEAISIRCYGEPVDWVYGEANRMIREFAYWSDIPVINMEDDMYHPCQAMADIMTIIEKKGRNLRGKKFVMSWAYSPSVEKPLAVPQSAITVASKFGLNITLAHPEGLELDPNIIDAVKENVREYGGSFEIVNDMKEAFKDADIVYPKAWTSKHFIPPEVTKPMLEKSQELFDKNKNWKTTKEMMSLAKEDAIYMHCLPADRGFEVDDDVMDGPQSVIFDEAENRLHAQKAIMALLMRR
ncbi:MAG TPA: N-acetylornithine carbamoyltransferase [Caldisericia bacterium]|jgi:N-acetylornithine carbamoyltransferase|nr:N-acetylornithine carbamoyltransferase [Caldisericia bacterium]HPB33667.1 N-acetylornithine carbamoyltransferase [Caldisericia bacterium]HQL66510.1 N-acetylornithine carbamoyltransferase [Caldisericia bacterium]HQN48064.1 N-acetylornithine carbamoyltransferase [Caldisericia bacterium]HQO99199.1 N-acetylornithine carbamoyltransferase [Caldisericia bacterium]